MYRLIALDLDDTLLDSEKRMSERTIGAVRAAADSGVRVIIASGRAYLGVTKFLDMLDLHDMCIVTGGAVIMDADGHVMDREAVPADVTHAVMQWAKDRGIYFQVYVDDGFWYETPTAATRRYEEHNGYLGVHVPDLSARSNIEAAKILFIGTVDEVAEWGRALAKDFPDLSVETSDPTFLEISSPRASKGRALLTIGKHLGIPPSETLAIGDSEIDKSMIEAAGMGIAMANAAPDVLMAADYVTGPCNEDGAAAAIEEFVLGAPDTGTTKGPN